MIPPRLAARRTALALTLLALAGCTSPAPTRFHTLLPPAAAPHATVQAAAQAAYAIEVLPAEVPAQVDVPQLVVRRGDGELTLVETRQWAAPLPSELRGALSDRLRTRLGVRDVYRLAPADTLPVWQVKLAVQRFDIELGVAARLDAGWSLRSGDAVLSCASQVREAVGAGFDAAVQGQQRALMAVADAIATAIEAAQSGRPPACPR